MALLGAYHGINPGMGWLFAVALGLQRGSARGVWAALPPIALGHALSVGAVVLIGAITQLFVPVPAMKATLAVLLMTLGGYRLWRHRHPRFGGMQVGFRDLTLWSFLMASAHGAGFMVLPFVIGMPSEVAAATHGHAGHVGTGTSYAAMLAVSVHTVAYLLVTAAAAWIIYWKVGLSLLRTAWFNLDWLWAGVLVFTGAVVLLT
jgi:hypothetical protein